MVGIAFALLGLFSLLGFATGVLMERGSVRRTRFRLRTENEVLREEIADLRWKIRYYEEVEKKEFAKKQVRKSRPVPTWKPDYVIQELG